MHIGVLELQWEGPTNNKTTLLGCMAPGVFFFANLEVVAYSKQCRGILEYIFTHNLTYLYSNTTLGYTRRNIYTLW